MKVRLFVTAALALLACCLLMKNHGSLKSESGTAAPTRPKANVSEGGGDPEASGAFRTKVANREPEGPRATHSPERLKEFMLPEVTITGLTLGEALQKLMGVYEETCGKTDETPLRLTFDLPPENAKKLDLKLSPRNFNSSVLLLATYSGMKLSRNKTAFHFEPFPDERKQVSLAFDVPPDFASRLIELARFPPLSRFEQFEKPSFVEAFANSLPIGEILETSRLDLDPSTQLTLGPSGSLKLETTSGADAALISALTNTLNSEKPIQHKFTSQVVEIPAGSNWTPPDVSLMTDGELQSLIREIAGTQGNELVSLPSITARSGQEASSEVFRNNFNFTQAVDTGNTFEKHAIGKAVTITGNALGFGHETTVRYTDTDTVSGSDETGKSPNAITRTDLANSGYSPDGGSRLVVQTRPDGSKTLLIVTSQLIDATGRPLHGGE